MKSSHKTAVRVRIAPSPTGPLHLGTVRTALFNWLFARHYGGIFILRIENTDAGRSAKRFEENIFEGLEWLGIDWDEGPIAGSQLSEGFVGDYGPYRQSERLDIYEKYIKKLLDEQKAYYCYCTRQELEAERESLLTQGLPPKYMGRCRSQMEPPLGKKAELIRFKVVERLVEFNDLIRGKIAFDTSLIGDIAIAKNGRTPLYNFAVVVDDATMKISHVIRGEDHIPNTPKQILLQEALGFEEPVYAHLPLILSPDRRKLSKRFAEMSILNYRDQGYLPEAMVNFLAFLGWHPQTEKDVMSVEDLIQEFDLGKVQKSGAIFNEEKLNWLNGEYLKKYDNENLTQLLLPRLAERGLTKKPAELKKIITLMKGRMKTLNDFFALADFFFEFPEYNAGLLIWKNNPREVIRENVEEVLKVIATLNEVDFSATNIEAALKPLSNSRGSGEVFWPLRVALSGKKASPGPFEIAEILGKEETLHRLEIALKKLV